MLSISNKYIRKSVFVLLCVYTIMSLSVHAQNKELCSLNIIDEKYPVSNTITREECLFAVMRIIGLNDKIAESINGRGIVAFMDTYSTSRYVCAWASGIAFGEECAVKDEKFRTSRTKINADYYFFPNRKVTVCEALTFMVRCLEDEPCTNLDYMLKRAQFHGLINDNDLFIKNCNLYIETEDFYTLLKRFMLKNRYKYFDNSGSIICSRDESRSISYYDMITGKNNKLTHEENMTDDILYNLKIIDENYFLYPDSVTRGEVLVAVMRSIGMSDEMFEQLPWSDHYSFVDTMGFSYIGIAENDDIALGENVSIDFKTYRTSHMDKDVDIFFFPLRKVTFGETVAFMIRCLEKTEYINKEQQVIVSRDLDYLWERAKFYNLIIDGDLFESTPEALITHDEFLMLLKRFINQKRYKYYEKNNYQAVIDVERSVTYYTMHLLRQEDGLR